MSDSSDSAYIDSFAKSNALQNKRRNRNRNGGVVDPRDLPGPSGVGSRRHPQQANVPRNNIRPEYYRLSDWFVQEMPQKTYFPQVGDDVVYFRQGHEIYLSIVRSKYPWYYVSQYPAPWSLLNLSAREYCRVMSLDFVFSPSRMCRLKLRLMRDRQLTNKSFTICYHAVPEAQDFLVLRDIYNQCSKEKWRVGQRFRCSMPNNVWRRGTITSINALDRRFPHSPFKRYRVRWDDDTVDRISAWDLEPNNYESTVSPRYARLTMRREELDLWQGVFRECDWPLGDRDLFLERIAPKLDLMLDQLVCEPFVDAWQERTDPVYLSTVAYPVDIGLILLRLDSGFYRRVSSVIFDLEHMLKNAAQFYTWNHNLVKVAKLSSDMLKKIIRDCNSDISLKIMYRHSMDAVCYTETETEEDKQKSTKKKKLKRLKKPDIPSIEQLIVRSAPSNRQDRSNDENRPPIIQEISNNVAPQDVLNSPKRRPLSLHQPRVPSQAENSGALDNRESGQLAIIQVNRNGGNKLPPSLAQKPDKKKIQPLEISQKKGNEENQPSANHSQERGSGISRPLTILQVIGNEENQPMLSCSEKPKSTASQVKDITHHQQRDSKNDMSLAVLQTNRNYESQISMSRPKDRRSFGFRYKRRLPNRPKRLFIPPVIIEIRGHRTNRPQYRTGKGKSYRRHVHLEEYTIKPNQPLIKYSQEYACMTLIPEKSDHAKPDSSTPEICTDCGCLANECRHSERAGRSVVVIDINSNQLPVSQPQERAATPSREIEGNQQSSSRIQVILSAPPEVDQGKPSTSRSRERTPTTPSAPEIDLNQPSTSYHRERTRAPLLTPDSDWNQPSTSRGIQRFSRSVYRSTDHRSREFRDLTPSNPWARRRTKKNFYLEQSRATANRHQQTQGGIDCVRPARKFAIKRPKETSSSSDISTSSSSDSDSRVRVKSKGTPKRARMRDLSKMKEWRADCLRALQALWEDEDCAVFRESAMQALRRSVHEWVSLEYIMNFLKSGVYSDPYAVVDDVHTMLLHGKTLILAGNEDMERIIDNLSLLFDQLIDPILQRWDSSNGEGEKEEEQEVYEYRETDSDSILERTLDEETSSSSVRPSSTPQSSP